MSQTITVEEYRRLNKVKTKEGGSAGEPPLERDEQVQVAQFLDAVFGDTNWCHVPNERSSKRQAGRLSEEGAKSGVPDILIFKTPLPDPSVFYPHPPKGVAIELKRRSRKSTGDAQAGASVTQKLWIESMRRNGWIAEICYGADEAIGLVKKCYGIR